MADEPKKKKSRATTPAKWVSRAPAVPKKKSTSVSPADPLLQAYLREVQKYPVLTREEERELAIHYHKTKDRETLQRLVTSNLRFVVKIAYEYVHYRAKLLDLIQEGNMGLVKAVQDFDPYKEVRLTTYAVWWIRSYIQDSILKNHSLVKIGTTQAQKRLFYRLRSETKKLEQEDVLPSERVKLLAARLDVKEKEVREMQQRLGFSEVSMTESENPDDPMPPMQALADEAAPVDEVLGSAEQKEIFGKILKEFGESLEGRERFVFTERLTSESPLSLQEIGDRYGFTKERARQIEEQIKNKLQQYVRERYPDFRLLTEEV